MVTVANSIAHWLPVFAVAHAKQHSQPLRTFALEMRLSKLHSVSDFGRFAGKQKWLVTLVLLIATMRTSHHNEHILLAEERDLRKGSSNEELS